MTEWRKVSSYKSNKKEQKDIVFIKHGKEKALFLICFAVSAPELSLLHLLNFYPTNRVLKSQMCCQADTLLFIYVMFNCAGSYASNKYNYRHNAICLYSVSFIPKVKKLLCRNSQSWSN